MFGFGSRYERFWKWFESHEEEIFCFERNREALFDKLASRLQRVHPDLTVEFSSVGEGHREFVVSAGGIKSAFPEVTALVRAAPVRPRWQIVAFRQRKSPGEIRFGDKALGGDAVFFDYAEAVDKIDLFLFLPGLDGSSVEGVTALKTIGFLLLDAILGEYDVETKIAGIDFVDIAAFPEKRRIPLRDLTGIVDGLPKAVQ
jgi:hypothetical protein